MNHANCVSPELTTTFLKFMKKIIKTEEEWKKILTPEQFHIMREKGTEMAYSCAWHQEDLGHGVFHCAACDLPLFSSGTKFASGTGWPSYFEPIDSENVEEKEDWSAGVPRTEVICARCGSHLGHVFEDVPNTPSGKRYCINSVSLNFKSS